VNPFTLGIEMVQDDDGALYEGQMDAAVKFLDFLTRAMSEKGHPIQRQVPVTADGKPVRGTIPRILNSDDAKKVVGIYGHRNQTIDRGPGDPGDYIFDYLLRAGYKGFNLTAGEDLLFWKDIQTKLGFTGVDCDGVPGRKTAAALALQNHGLWVYRPGD
jgi:hypothetical protein